VVPGPPRMSPARPTNNTPRFRARVRRFGLLVHPRRGLNRRTERQRSIVPPNVRPPSCWARARRKVFTPRHQSSAGLATGPPAPGFGNIGHQLKRANRPCGPLSPLPFQIDRPDPFARSYVFYRPPPSPINRAVSGGRLGSGFRPHIREIAPPPVVRELAVIFCPGGEPCRRWSPIRVGFLFCLPSSQQN